MKTCSQFEILISGYLDGELNTAQETALLEHLKTCAECRRELERGKMVNKALETAAIRTPEDDFWDGYWSGIYNRLERNTAWIFLVIGSVILASGFFVQLFHTLFLSDETPIWMAGGSVFGIIGLTILVVSLIRERVRVNRHERYKDIRR
jgi:predicted anti-sigma-YlaC factor YlaD